ncbi:MAG TPA: hypothetical protein VK611_21555 [Acidimicrobiales bacterium]|nr:hypothetical protein [Acidimicrobiales bacterium]
MWQAAASVAALLTAIAGGSVGIAGFVRSARAEDARRSADATGVGLNYLEKALAALQTTITRQEGDLGELRGQLRGCTEERQAMSAEIADLRRAIQ